MARAKQLMPYITVVAALVMAAVLLAVWLFPGGSKKSNDQTTPSGYGGFVVNPPLAKPEFTLTDTAGKTFDFQKETAGYLTLLYFGYTNCPDACPLQMGTVAAALRQLPAEDLKHVKVVFVTTDPKRDTPDALSKWLAQYDASFIGLTGSDAEIARAEQAAAVPLAEEEDLGNGSYGVSHAAQIIAYTQDNLAHLMYPEGVQLTDWVHDLKLLAKNGWQAT